MTIREDRARGGVDGTGLKRIEIAKVAHLHGGLRCETFIAVNAMNNNPHTDGIFRW